MKSTAKSTQPMRRAFGYARVSSDEEDGNNASIAAQIQALREYAETRNIELVAVFEEPDVSGRNAARRQFDRMVDLATSDEQPVEVVLAYSLSRFARRLLTQLTTEHRLAKAGVALITVLEGEANDANSKVVRNMFSVINEKYAVDASSFTRRDRRYNATRGYWNGGLPPFGYKAVVASTDGSKVRKKLALVEDETAIVRLIYDLALHGLDGQPMGTRSIQRHVNQQGYTLRGRPFRHSNVDGILTREHYVGRYFDRTCPDVDGKAKPEHAIEVPCPKIIEPEIAAAVAARRSAAAPKVTPPRVVNSPVLLTGICSCGAAGCGSGMIIRTGKGGRYSYYTCNRRAEAAGACRCQPIRSDELDRIVVDGLLERILDPARLAKLLSAVLDLSDAADEQRKKDLDRVRRQRVEAEAQLRRLLVVAVKGELSPSDKVLGGLLAEYKQSIASLSQTEANLNRALAASSNRITEATVREFGLLLKKRLVENATMRKAYVRLLVSRVTVNDNQIVIEGSKAALEAAVGASDPLRAGVPRFDREWCRLQDSNL